MSPKKSLPAFAVGDVVELKSGGPALTVLGQIGDRVHCVFFSDEIGEFREAILPVVALTEADEDDEDEEEEDGDAEDEDTDYDEDEDADEDDDKKKA
jgi:uncharacterized protein YodC (DUF2158 family)